MADIINNNVPKPVQVYGYAPNGQLQAVNTDGNGNLKCVTGAGGSLVVTIPNSVSTPAMIYGRAPDTTLQAVTTDGSGNLSTKTN